MINYKNIQSVADELLNLRSLESNKKMQEAYSRSAVSRAYYATFHIARNKMEKIKRKSNPKYTVPKGGVVHGEIQKFWRKEFKKSRKKNYLDKRLKQLREKRNQADYDLLNVFSNSEAIKYVKVARILIKNLERK